MKSKYAEGGDVERTKDYDKIRSYSLDDIKGFFGRSAPKEVKRETEQEREIRRETRGAVPGMGAETPASSQTFAQAFRAARRRGDSTFEWRGGRYTTQTASTPRAQAPRGEPPLVRGAPLRRQYSPDAGATGVEGAAPPRPTSVRRLTPEERARAASGGMSEEDLFESAARAARSNERRSRATGPYSSRSEGAVLGGVELRKHGGSIKKMASGGTCRGMGKASRGGDYKFR